MCLRGTLVTCELLGILILGNCGVSRDGIALKSMVELGSTCELRGARVLLMGESSMILLLTDTLVISGLIKLSCRLGEG